MQVSREVEGEGGKAMGFWSWLGESLCLGFEATGIYPQKPLQRQV